MPPHARRHFQLPEALHYLNCAFMGPLAHRVEEAGIQGMRRRRDPSQLGAADFFRESEALRDAFLPFLPGADRDGVALLPSVSYGVAIAARNAGLQRGDEVVLARDQFPGNVYGWMREAEAVGAQVRLVDPPATPGGTPAPGRGADWNARLLEAISPRTRVVSLGAVHWTDGTRFDLAALGARARAVGALLVVDGTQSVGALPFPFADIRPDAVITAGYKWLLGPYGMALGWFGPAFRNGIPLEESWIARKGSENFARLVEYEPDYAPGAVRFDVGERSDPIRLPMMLEALALLEELGAPASVDAHGRALGAPFRQWAREAGFGVDDEAAYGGHLFGVGLPAGLEPEAVAEALRARQVLVSVRGRALRISPHLYNDEGDMEALRGALEEVLP
jgi:selenocysteine lyase/cysteine desulfurase